jgi:putative salt-induced outer membrane protein YdiY
MRNTLSALLCTTGTLTLLTLTSITPAIAADEVQTDTNDITWSGRINFGGNVTDGNTNSKAAVLDGLAKARDDKNRYTAGAELRYAEDEGDETEDEYKIYGEYDRFLNEKLYAGARLSYKSDDIANLDRRIKVGPYMGYQYFESEDLNLSTRLGVDYINDEYENGNTEDSAAVSWGLDYDQRIIDDTLQIFYKHDVSVPTDDTDGFLYDGEAGVRFPIAKILTGSAQVDFDWDNDPAPGINENDTKYSLKLGYEF